MKNNILITVESRRHCENSDTDSNNFSCDGEILFRDGKYYIKYTEPSENGGASVVLKTDEKTVSMTRRGESSSHFIFESARIFKSRYITPFGSFIMDIKTRSISIEVSGMSGKIDLGYDLTVNEDEISENNFCLIYKKK
ncbi:MAG: DUF1934 domain-containing protein [Bacillota bacterium]|nr:DUF1934 domain-containing protein [Bacillota bacterium]